MDIQKTSTVLAALRYWQWKRYGQHINARMQDILGIESNGGTVERMTDEEIDALCEEINCGNDEALR